jgi:colanic acid biosynthesis glycosyl transferase WcaI
MLTHREELLANLQAGETTRRGGWVRHSRYDLGVRIMLLTQWFDPEPTLKGMLFARELVSRGHDVTVVTGFPNYPGGKIYPGYSIRPFTREDISGVHVVRVALYPSHDGSAVKRVLNYLSFALSASVAVLVVRRPDVAYVYHPPATVGVPGILLKTFRRVPFVYDIQDLWPDTLASTGMIRDGSRALRVVDLVLRRIYSNADRIVVLSSGFKTALVKRGVPEEKVEVIPNWADEAQMSVADPSPSRRRELGFDDRCTITFAGNMGAAQDLDTVLNAAELLRGEGRVRFLLIGAGIDRERLEMETERRELANVWFLPRLPFSEIGEILKASTALLVHLRDDPLFEITIPSKTQAYLMTGRPILMGVRGDAAAMVSEADAGFVFEPGDASSLATAVRRLLSMAPQDLTDMGQRGMDYYYERLALNVGVTRFEAVLDQASGSTKRSPLARLLSFARLVPVARDQRTRS